MADFKILDVIIVLFIYFSSYFLLKKLLVPKINELINKKRNAPVFSRQKPN